MNWKLFFFALFVIAILLLKINTKKKMQREWEEEKRRIYPDPIAAQIIQMTDDFFYKLCSNIGVITEEKSPQDGMLRRCVGMFNNQKVQLNLEMYQEPIPPAPPVMERRKKVLFPPSDDWREKVPIKKYEVLEIRIPVKQKFWLRMNRERLREEDT